MKKNRLFNILKFSTLTLLTLTAVFPTVIKAEDTDPDAIKIVEYRACTDPGAGWKDPEKSAGLTIGASSNCFLARGSSYKLTALYKDGTLNDTMPTVALRLNVNLLSPAQDRLDIVNKKLVTDDTTCKKTTNYFGNDEGIYAGLGQLLKGVDERRKEKSDNHVYVTTDEQYFASLAMSQFISEKLNKSSYALKGESVSNDAIASRYNELEEGYIKATTAVPAQINNKTIKTFKMQYMIDDNNKDYLYKSSFITFKDAMLLDKYTSNKGQVELFNFTLKNKDTGELYDDYVYAAIQNNKSTGDYDLVYQFGICDSLDFQVKDYANCKALKGKKLPAGNYELVVSVNDAITYSKVKTIYSCTSSSSTTGYTPIVLSNGNYSTAKNSIKYDLTSEFTVESNPTPVVPDDKPIEKIGTIKVSIVDKNKKLLTGVKFQICEDRDCNSIKNTATSTNESYIAPNIPFGKYYIVVTEVPKGYVVPTTVEVAELSTSNTVAEKTIVIEATTNVPDTLSNISKLFLICGIVGIIAGTYLVYSNAKKQEEV